MGAIPDLRASTALRSELPQADLEYDRIGARHGETYYHKAGVPEQPNESMGSRFESP